MRFGAAYWIQRTDWPDLRDACLEAEQAGFDSLWLDDHLLSDEGDWRDSKLEGWAALAALAPLTKAARLGLLVAANTFRNPGVTAKMATTIDHLSGGRALCLPRPVQARLPILIGGSGREKTLRTTARHADLWNGYGEAARIAETSDVLRQRCAEVGREFDAIERTVTMDLVIRDTPEAAKAAYHEIERIQGIAGRVGSDGSPRGLNVGGPPDEIARYVDALGAIGISEVMWVFRHPFDLETIRRLPEVRAALTR